MSFGSVKGMARRLAKFDQDRALVLDMTDVPMLDYTMSRASEDMNSRGAGYRSGGLANPGDRLS